LNRVDLHLHSTASDGRLSPAELVARAAALGLTYIALTDHDTVAGLPEAIEAARAFPGLTLLPGVELSTDTAAGETHVLGYFIDTNDAAFLAALSRFRDSREHRGERMVAKLNAMGVAITWARVQEIAGEAAVGRPHIALAMLEKGCIQKFEDAFHGYVEQGGPAYAEREKLTPAEAVRLITAAGGLPVLAHPVTTGDPEGTVKTLKPAGLVGLEAYYHENAPGNTKAMLDLAARYRLAVTGGSDFHGEGTAGGALGGTEVPVAAARRLISLHQGSNRPRGDV
jgi:predicted metal-dependent phosphoesterase TrpH